MAARDLVVLMLLTTGLLLSLFFIGYEGPLFYFTSGLLWVALGVALYNSAAEMRDLVSPLFCVLILLAGWEVASLLWTPVPGYSQTLLWRHLAVPAVVAICISCRDERFWTYLKRFLLLAGVGLCLFALVQQLNSQDPRATFLNRNSFAGFLLPLVLWCGDAKQEKSTRLASGAFLFLAGLALGLIGSRGALLGLGAALLFLCLIQVKKPGTVRYLLRAQLPLGLGLVSSLLLTGIQSSAGLGRLGELGSTPIAAASSRLMIWQASLDMFRDAPWHGYGVGLYGLLYPRYRLYEDLSAGHYAHNDLLQIAIESGWPGLFLALVLLLLVAVAAKRAITEAVDHNRKSEAVQVSAALLGLSVHSMLTFNAYVFSTLIVGAFLLARLIQLSRKPVTTATNLAVKTQQAVRLAALLVIVPLFYLLCGGWSQVNSNRAISAHQEGKTAEAISALKAAQRFWQVNDFNWYLEGEILRMGLAQRNDLSAADRDFLVRYILDAFHKADQLNPLRPMTPHRVAKTLEDQESVSVETIAKIELNYQEALRRDPRYVPARVDYLNFLLNRQQTERARFVVMEGLRYAYLDSLWVLPLLEKALFLEEQVGDVADTSVLTKRIERIREKWSRTP